MMKKMSNKLYFLLVFIGLDRLHTGFVETRLAKICSGHAPRTMICVLPKLYYQSHHVYKIRPQNLPENCLCLAFLHVVSDIFHCLEQLGYFLIFHNCFDYLFQDCTNCFKLSTHLQRPFRA